MRLVPGLLVVLMVVSCAPVREPEPRQVERARAVPVETPVPATKPETAAHPAAPPRTTHTVVSGITFEGVAFDARNHRLVVIDQAGGPGSRFADAAAAARTVGGLAAVNGGFFTPEGEPLGLVIAAGKRSGAWNSASSLGSGVWHASGSSAISRREKLGRAAAGGMRDLLQAGPILVENGRIVSGLDALKTSARTMILWDGGSRWWIGCSTPATLAQTAAALAGTPVPGWPVRHALNLDGGRSSDLWISAAVPGGPLTRRPAWNRPVRNFLALVPVP
ncbi:MAG: hypothetical protein EHM17_07615 [Verrucomicrobiaceae bacterium]|nr:MAG: hypothetical protein EHM17_07615 [Verrucomicrobiaceae bacterium]